MIAISLNFLIRSFFVFLIAYLWATFFFNRFFVSFMVAFMITVLVNCLFSVLALRKQKRLKLTKKEREERALYTLQLRFLTQDESTELLKKALLALGSDSVVFSYFHTQPTVGEVAQCIRQNHGKKTIIAACGFCPGIMQLVSTVDVDVTLLNDVDVYNKILKPAEILPQVLFRPKSRTRLTLAALKQMMLNRTRTRGYVFIGIIILLTSFLVSFPLYYIIFATFLFGMATVSYFIPESRVNAL